MIALAMVAPKDGLQSSMTNPVPATAVAPGMPPGSRKKKLKRQKLWFAMKAIE